jgi:hypothetical protein
MFKGRVPAWTNLSYSVCVKYRRTPKKRGWGRAGRHGWNIIYLFLGGTMSIGLPECWQGVKVTPSILTDLTKLSLKLDPVPCH